MTKYKSDSLTVNTFCSASLPEFKKFLAQCTSQQMRDYVNGCQGLNPFHHVLDKIDSSDTREKIHCLMQHANRLGLDPNETFRPKIAPSHLDWDNSPLHHCIAFENLCLIPVFLDSAQEANISINLNAIDKAGKTPLMFAIKLGWSPLEIIKLLITPQNYNQPESSGMTPMMAAFAMRRMDIAKLILQFEANRLKLGELNFSNLTNEQINQLSPFIHQVHPESGKTLGHYALMRTGTLVDQRKDLTYQETILNVLKSAGVDGLRDEVARWNSVVTAKREGILYQGPPGTTSLISFINMEDFGNKVYLNAKVNEQILLDMSKDDMNTYFRSLFNKFTGTSLADSISKRSQNMIHFLVGMRFDFSLTQTNGKTMVDYIHGLMKASNPNLINPSDEQHLFKLKQCIADYTKQCEVEKISFVVNFFEKKSFKTELVDLIVSYSSMNTL